MKAQERDMPVIAQKVKIEIPDERGGVTVYHSWVEECAFPRVTLAASMAQGSVVSLKPDSQLTVFYHDERGFFKLWGRVAGCGGEPPIVTIEVDEIEKKQKREYFRWQTIFPMRYFVRDAETRTLSIEKIGPNQWFWAQTRDISAGGLMLESTRPLELGSILVVEVDLSGQKVQAEGQVVRVSEVSDAGRGPLYLIGLRFTRINQINEDRLVGFIFREQARLRKEGKL